MSSSAFKNHVIQALSLGRERNRPHVLERVLERAGSGYGALAAAGWEW